MPEMDGREALAEILKRQQDGQLARQELDPTVLPLSIIAITANVMKGDREKFMRDGFSEVIAKPFNEKDLLDAIEAHAPHQRQLNRPAVVVRTDTLSDSDVAVPEPDHPQAVDQSVLDRLLETFGADFFSTSISIFTDEIDGRMMLLENPSVSLDVTRREAHAIKGSSASYGLTALSALAAQLEETPERRETALSQMNRHWDHARALLKSKCL
jgi:HPt (histidine-containing phosphotransfer) domain-containing protein